MQEVQGTVAERYRIAGSDLVVREWPILLLGLQECLQHGRGAGRDVQARLWCPSHQFRQGPTVVRLQMVEYDDPDLRVVRDRLQPAEELVGELELHRIDDRDARLPADQKGVVGGPVGAPQDDVEGSQRRVQGTDPMHPGGDLDRVPGIGRCLSRCPIRCPGR